MRGTVLHYPFCEKCIVKKRCYATLGWQDSTLNDCKVFIAQNPRSQHAAAGLQAAAPPPEEPKKEEATYTKHEWIEEVEEITDDDIVVPGEEGLKSKAPEPAPEKGAELSQGELSSIDQLYNDALHSKSFAADSARKNTVKKLPDAKQRDPDFKVRKRGKAEPVASGSSNWLNEVEELDLNDLRAEVIPPAEEAAPEAEEEAEPSPEEIKKMRRKEAAEAQSFMLLQAGFHVAMGVIENMGGNKLRGLQENCNNELVQSNLEECALEFREMIGLDEMDPWTKLCLSVAVIAGATFTQNAKAMQDEDLYEEEEEEKEVAPPKRSRSREKRPKVAPATVVIDDEDDLYRDL